MAASWSYPLGPSLMASAILLYVLALWRWPSAWMICVPAMLPVLDLAPWTGRFFFDEFDCLIAATLAFELVRSLHRPKQTSLGPMPSMLLVCIALSALISVVIGMSPLMSIDVNSFNNYFSSFNALRVTKGLIWALLMLPVYRRALAQDAALTHRRFALGMSIGVLLAALSVAWERAVFPGWFNFHSVYRVVGMFSGMHIGGSYIEAYFATALPFVAWWTLHAHPRSKRILGATIFVLGIYALVVTYARGAYLALAIGMMAFAFAIYMQRHHERRAVYIWRGAALITLLTIVALPVVNGTTMQRRYAHSQRDFGARASHWFDAVRMMDATGTARLFGMGLGSYPRLYYFNSAENIHSSLYMFAQDSGKHALFLSSGEPTYFEQFVDLNSQHNYSLTFAVRNIFGESELMFPICEKWMLYSVNCVSPSVTVLDQAGKWKSFTLTFDGKAFLSRSWLTSTPIKFAIFNNSNDSIVAISDVSLRDESNREYLKNGNFTDGMDHWFFTSDNHLPWHLENVWVQVYFEQGAFGLLIFLLLIVSVMRKLIALNRLHHPFAPAMLASFAAFLALSLIDSIFDFPRMSFLIYTMAFWVLSLPLQTAQTEIIEARKYDARQKL